jgi:hypothetical protein
LPHVCCRGATGCAAELSHRLRWGIEIDIHLVETVLTAPGDPRKTDLVAELAGVPSRGPAAARTTPAPRRFAPLETAGNSRNI